MWPATGSGTTASSATDGRKDKTVKPGQRQAAGRILPLASVAGLVALLPQTAWFVLKPNRLVDGTASSAWAAAPLPAALLLATWLCFVLPAVFPVRAGRAAGPLAALATLLLLWAAGSGAAGLMQDQTASARVALSAGFWFSLVATYVAWFGAFEQTARGGRRWMLVPAVVTGAAVVLLIGSGLLAELGLARELASQGTDFRAELGRHLGLSLTSLLVGTGVGVPLAVAAHRNRNLARWLLPGTAFLQTVPSLALFGLLLPLLARTGQDMTIAQALLSGIAFLPLVLTWRSSRAWLKGLAWLLALVPLLLWLTVLATVIAGSFTGLLAGATSGGPAPAGLSAPLATLGVRGIGMAPALIALTLYSLLPVVRNTFEGLEGVPAAAVDAGRGMGMSQRQVLFRVKAPLALPVVLDGIRAAAVLIIGITTISFLIGAGGLGVFIQRGIDQVVPDLVLLGALPVIGLALLADGLLRVAGRLLTPKPLRNGGAPHAT